MEVEAPSNPTETFTPVTDIEMTNTDTTASLKTNETDVKQGASVAVEGEDATQDVTEGAFHIHCDASFLNVLAIVQLLRQTESRPRQQRSSQL